MVSAQTASKGLTEAIKPLQADLFVLRGKTKPKRKGRAPIDYEIHVNPLGIGLAAVGAGLTLWLMQLRMQPVMKEESTVIPAEGHWYQAAPTYGHRGEVFQSPPVWIEDKPAKTVTVKKKSFSIEQRQPFLGGGSPMDLGGPFGKGAPGFWKLLTDPWGVFPW